MLLRNCRLVGGKSDRVDIRIDGGLIVELLPPATIERSGGDAIDLDGRWVAPGLWDNHVHFTQWSLRQQWLDVSHAASARQTALLVGEALANRDGAPSVARDGAPFVAIGFRDGLWPDAPNLADLDAVSRERPVVIASADLHSAWLNTAALDRFGHAGHPTGLLREDEAFRIAGFIAEVPDDVTDRLAFGASAAAARRGVVGIVDLEMAWNLESWQRRQSAGNDLLRVDFGIYPDHLDRAIELGLRTGQRVSELLTVGRLKVLADGSLNTRTAYCYEPYLGTVDSGVLTVPPDRLLELMRRAAAAGIESSVHAIGDHANSLALDAFEQLSEMEGAAFARRTSSGAVAPAGLTSNGIAARAGHRTIGRIEHAQLLAEVDLARFAELGVVASVQPEHAMDDRDVADHYWEGRTQRMIPSRSLLDAGATLAFGSDAPVAPLDPWLSAAAAVTRSRDGREPWHPEQSVSVSEALAASTRTTVAIGERADLVVVDADPFTSDLRSMPVAATLLGGRFTYSSL
jgi:predicted amidohydrolase YtcJ